MARSLLLYDDVSGHRTTAKVSGIEEVS